MNWFLFGATGFVGRYLVQELLLDEGNELQIVVRTPRKSDNPRIRYVSIVDDGALLRDMEGSDIVVNLAGESIAGKRWTPERKRAIQNSRVEMTRHIVDLISRASHKPKYMVNASAVGYYGIVSNFVDESSPAGDDFLARVCVDWEAEASKAKEMTRLVILRFGIVLGRGGGFMEKVISPFRYFMGTMIGSGDNYMSWIHVKDLVRFISAIPFKGVKGVINMVSADPVQMRVFYKTLAEKMGRPLWIRIPQSILSFFLGKELTMNLLASQIVKNTQLKRTGYSLRYPTLEEALDEILEVGKKGKPSRRFPIWTEGV